MKILNLILTIVGVLAVIIGGIWVLQGVNILPGSFMTGHMQWAYRGAGLIVVGAIAIWFSRRRRT